MSMVRSEKLWQSVLIDVETLVPFSKEVVMNHEQLDRTLNALVEGNDLKGGKPYAKFVLRELFALTPHEHWQITVPVVRRLMSCDGWQEKLILSDVVVFCAKRYNAVKLLHHGTQRTEDVDCEAEFMAGLAETFANAVGLTLPPVWISA